MAHVLLRVEKSWEMPLGLPMPLEGSDGHGEIWISSFLLSDLVLARS